MSSDPPLQPFRLKHLTLRNRFMSTPCEPAYTEDGLPEERCRLHLAEKAEGGIALTTMGGSAAVAPDSPQAFGSILLCEDECVRWLAELAEDVHAHGAAAMTQVTHLGRRTSWSKADWPPILAPSAVREPAPCAFPKAMEDWDIACVAAAYADGAELVKASGIDGIELECCGHIDTEEGLSRVIPSMGSRSGPHLDFAGEVRAARKVATFRAARIQDVATARHAVETARLDMAGMTRARMADPHIARKVMARREDGIRPRVGMGYCIDSICSGQAVCIHDAATGREATMPHVVARSDGPRRKVVVIGAGPAGLEAARVSAARGRKVVVFEAGAEAGGQIRLTAAPKRRREILGIVDWRLAECGRDGVESHFNRYAEGRDVVAEEPDTVAAATGGLPDTSFLDAGEDLVTTGWDILSGAARPAGAVIVYDDNGAHPGTTAAEFVAGAGSKLGIVMPGRTLAPDVGGTGFPACFRTFPRKGATMTLDLRLEEVRRDGNRLVGRFHGEYGRRHVEKRADQIVAEHGTLPLDDLHFELKPQSLDLGEIGQRALVAARPQTVARNPPGRFRLLRIGDAVAGRHIHAAVCDARRLTKDI